MEKPAKDKFDPKSFLAKVGAGKQVLEFQKNQHVFEQGDVADTVFYIQKGKVKLTVLSEQGKEAVVAILEPGQFFGEGCMNGHARRIATTTAMEDCLITAITKAAMIAAIHDEPRFSELCAEKIDQHRGPPQRVRRAGQGANNCHDEIYDVTYEAADQHRAHSGFVTEVPSEPEYHAQR
jgi:CRP-like cAMP-binding protein